MDLVLERREEPDRTAFYGTDDRPRAVMSSPTNLEDYWRYRVPLSKNQAIVGFPKLGTIGIGFEIEEEDWNRNSPYAIDAEGIFNWIRVNKGDDSISDEDCLAAIRMIQEAAAADMTRPRG